MSKTSAHTFTTFLCFVLAILLLGWMLMTQIRLNSVREEIRTLEQERTELIRDNRILRVRLSSRLPLPELERYATEVLGMQRQRCSQAVIVGEA